MEQNNLEQQVSTPMPPKPDNNMVLAIACTVCCCLPLGIVGIIKASKVNGLYLTKQYEAAALMAQDAVIQVIYVIFYGAAIASQL